MASHDASTNATGHPFNRASLTLILGTLGLLGTLMWAATGCGGGCGDKTPPTIVSVSVAPNQLDYHGGQATVTVQATDNNAAASSLVTKVSLLNVQTSSTVSGPVTLAFSAPQSFTGTIVAPGNATTAALALQVKVTVREPNGNQSQDVSQSITVAGLAPPPPPP